MPKATPIYLQIMEDIRTKVSAGELNPGDRLPTLNEMTAQYGCSAEPVKMALRMLSAAGDTIGHQGRGHYIASIPDRVQGR